jgi:hypothetical protein
MAHYVCGAVQVDMPQAMSRGRNLIGDVYPDVIARQSPESSLKR